MTRIQKAARALIDKHGSLRRAQAVSGISYSLLSKIANGQHVNPTAETLEKLGLHVRRNYIRKEQS
jgi:hypothetical protein